MPAYLDPPPLAFAHRGGAKTATNIGIENSLAAFRHAYNLGYRYLETDVRRTVDGAIYAVHDPSLERLCGSTGVVATMTSEMLENELLDGREPLVRLEVLLQEFPDARLNIDVKADDAVEATCDLIRSHHATERICLSSFSHARLARMRSLLPDVTTSASTREAALARLFPAPLLRMFGSLGSDCLQVPHRHRGIPVVTRGFVRRAHRLGQQVHVWTINDVDEMNLLLDLGVDGIMTDRTDLLRDVLVSRGSWKDPT